MKTLGGKIESFVIVTTLAEQEIADKISGALEDIGIPIILEHVAGSESNLGQRGFRILTQSRYSENAMRIADNLLSAYKTRQLVTTRDTVN